MNMIHKPVVHPPLYKPEERACTKPPSALTLSSKKQNHCGV